MTPMVGPDEWDTNGVRDAVFTGLWDRIENLEREVSRLRECRDVWKLQAESLASRRRGVRGWLYRKQLLREFRREWARDPMPRVLPSEGEEG